MLFACVMFMLLFIAVGVIFIMEMSTIYDEITNEPNKAPPTWQSVLYGLFFVVTEIVVALAMAATFQEFKDPECFALRFTPSSSSSSSLLINTPAGH